MFHEWKEEYNLGIKELDDQHRKMLEMMAELHDAIDSGKEKSVLDAILQGLLEATKKHFETEEGYFHEFHYEHTEEHERQHGLFEKRVEKLIETFEHGKNLSEHLAEFLEEWLEHHIGEQDRKFVKLFHEKGL